MTILLKKCLFVAFGLVLTAGFTTFARGADLTVADVDVSQLTVDCQTLEATGSVSAVIKNVGESSTEAGFAVIFFEDHNENGTYEVDVDLFLGEDSVESLLGPDEETIVSTAVNATVMFFGNLVYVFADSDDDIFETDEANNVGNSGSACQFEPQPGVFDPVLEWSWTSSSVEPNALNVMMTPGVIDLNDDGIPDVVFGSTPSTTGGVVEVGFLRALSGGDGSELFTVTASDQLVNTASSVAVGDIDLDSRPEILACHSSGNRLMAFEHDGSFKWLSPVLETINWGAPSLADIDTDGTPEIVIGRQVLNADGTVRWTGTGGSGIGGASGPISLVADIDLDGSPNVVGGNTLSSATGSIIWQNTSVPDGLNAVANFDADTFPEIVLVAGGSVWLLEHTGLIKWGPVSIPGGGRGGPPTIADYDGDGEVEVGVAGAARYVVFETDGSVLWTAVTQDGSSNVTGSSVFDFEGDGAAEVVYRDELKLRVYRGTDGAVLFETPMSSCTWHEYVLVADVDADGNAEIVAVANNNCGFGTQRGIFVFGDANDSWVATRPLWNQHTYHITNIDDDGTIPVVEQDNWLYPPADPFNNYRQNLLTEASPLIAPDLTVSFLRLDDSECPEGVGLVARIGNGGANVVGAQVNVAFYDGDPDAGGILLGVAQTTQNLNPGQFEDIALVVTPPLDGSHMICAVVDDDGTGAGAVSECDETNNSCCALFEEFCPPEVLFVSLDIKPTSCPNPLNTRSQGLLPVAILGTADFDVETIDPNSLLLEGVAPIRDGLQDVGTPFGGELCDCTTEGPDGFLDLTLKFRTQEIVAALGSVEDREERALTLTGQLMDGTPIEGSDCVWILANGDGKFPSDREPTVGEPGILWIRPNPLQLETHIAYYLPTATRVSVSIYDVSGRRVEQLVDGEQSPGEHVLAWDASGLARGAYFMRFVAGRHVRVERITVSE
jgi:hypothetical protein